jgi:hypothetical protein
VGVFQGELGYVGAMAQLGCAEPPMFMMVWAIFFSSAAKTTQKSVSTLFTNRLIKNSHNANKHRTD